MVSNVWKLAQAAEAETVWTRTRKVIRLSIAHSILNRERYARKFKAEVITQNCDLTLQFPFRLVSILFSWMIKLYVSLQWWCDSIPKASQNVYDVTVRAWHDSDILQKMGAKNELLGVKLVCFDTKQRILSRVSLFPMTSWNIYDVIVHVLGHSDIVKRNVYNYVNFSGSI